MRDVACNAGVFFGRANVFAHESAMLKLPEERRKWGESKEVGRGRREKRKRLPENNVKLRNIPQLVARDRSSGNE